MTAAIQSAGQTRNRQFIPVLIGKLADPRYKKAAAEAIFNFGAKTMDILIHYLNDPKEEIQVRLNIPPILADLGGQQAANTLIQNLDQPDARLRDGIIKALHDISGRSREIKLDEGKIVKIILDEAQNCLQTLAVLYFEAGLNQDEGKTSRIKEKRIRKRLIAILEKRLDDDLERIFRLLGLKYPHDDIQNIYLGVRSRKSDIRINAVEFLDNLLSANLKKVIIPIIEMTLVDGLVKKSLARLNIHVNTEFEALTLLLNENDVEILCLTLKLMAELKDERYVPHVGSLIHHENEEIRNNAEAVLKNLEILK